MKFYILMFLLLFSTLEASSQNAPAATSAANEYLESVKTIDLPDSKKTLSSLEFDSSSSSYPTITSWTTLAERFYQTDVPGVLSYRLLLSVVGISKANTPITKKYVLVAYKDKVSGKWKIVGLSQGTDVEMETQSAGNDLTDTKYVAAKYNYRRYGYWLLMAGKITEAQKAFEQAEKLNTQADSSQPAESKEQIDAFSKSISSYLDIIQRISKKDEVKPQKKVLKKRKGS